MSSVAACLIAATVLAYHETLRVPFLFDDAPTIVENPTIRQLWPPWDALSPPREGGLTVSGRPLVNLSLAINFAIGGTRVAGYHGLNLAIHIASGLTLFGIVRRLCRRTAPDRSSGNGDTVFAGAVSALWLLHPLQTEAVTYIVQRAESLMALFLLLMLYGLIRSTEAKSPQPWRVLAVAACWLGMASKESMVVAPLLALFCDRTFLAGTFARAWQERGGFHLALAGSWLLLGWLVFSVGDRGGTAGFGNDVTPWHYALTQCRAIPHYVRLALWPHPLVFDYGTDVVRRPGEVVPQILLLAIGLGATAWALRRRPAIGFLGASFFLLLAPSSSVVPVVTQTMAEHRMYLPLAAIVALGGVAASAVVGPRGWLLLGAIALACGGATFIRNRDYASAVILWQDTVARRPENMRAHYNLGNALLEARRPEEAIASYRRALELKPGQSGVHYNLGGAFEQLGRWEHAAEAYRTAAELDPAAAVAHYNLAVVLERLNRPDEAVQHYEAAIALQPDYAKAHYNLGNARVRERRLDAAARHFETVLRIDPNHVDALCNLGNVRFELGDADAAAQLYQRAVQLAPRMADAHLNLGIIFLALNRIGEARKELEEAARLDPGRPEPRELLRQIPGTYNTSPR